MFIFRIIFAHGHGFDADPDSVKIPGESPVTKVYEYKQRPTQCKKCQQYGHTINRCRIEFTMCGKCAAVGHKSEVCGTSYLKCCHCSEPHTAWNRKCKENLFQSEVSQIMHSETAEIWYHQIGDTSVPEQDFELRICSRSWCTNDSLCNCARSTTTIGSENMVR